MPSCVSPGGRATVRVTTRPEASVVYHAVYSDGQGGSDPPFGASYGGSDQGVADTQGRYVHTWTVAKNAPAGDARVDVSVASTAGLARAKPTFAVADASGDC